MAACAVHRPSPESATCPANCCRSRIGGESARGQIEQPRSNHAAVAPELGDVVEGEVVLKVFVAREAARCRRSAAAVLSGAGVLEEVEAFGVCGHQRRTRCRCAPSSRSAPPLRAAMQVTEARQCQTAAAAGTTSLSVSGRESRERSARAGVTIARIAANHEAIAALEPPDASAHASVDVLHTGRAKRIGPPNVVDVMRVAAVNDDVTGSQMRGQHRRSRYPRREREPSARSLAASRVER